jgi:hypothetical protein
MGFQSLCPAQVIASRITRGRQVALALSKAFDSRWIGELPVVFDGTPQEVTRYALDRGYVWRAHDEMLLGGCFEHLTEPDTLYPL